MSNAETKPEDKSADLRIVGSAQPTARNAHKAPMRIISLLLTLVTTGAAVVLGWAMWGAYMAAPWTRDGTVRTYVVTMAPEVAGRIVELSAVDNQFVQKGDLLLVIDPTNYKIALQLADAAVDQAQATAQNAQREAERRRKLDDLSVSVEQKQVFDANAVAARRNISRRSPTAIRPRLTWSAPRSVLR